MENAADQSAGAHLARNARTKPLDGNRPNLSMQNTTYRAVLKGDRLEWLGEVPPEIDRDRAVPVDVSILCDERFSASHAAHAGERMAAALEKLAASQSASSIEDPVAWQREARRDRLLPDRD